MSHFTRVKTDMVEKEYLIRALKDLGYAYEEGGAEIGGYAGSAPVDIKVTTSSSGYNIGFRKVGGTYEIVADWWGIYGTRKRQFLQQVTQRYAYHATRAILEEQGFDVVSEQLQQGKRIHLVLRRTG